MDKISKLDLVFVVGPFGQRTQKRISRVANQLAKSVKDCRVASIHFYQEYEGTLRRNLFCNFVSDFSNDYRDRTTSEGNPLQYGYPLQHVSSLSFRHDAARICFLISNVLPFNDYEETIIYNNEIGNDSPSQAGWDSNSNTESGKTENVEGSSKTLNGTITDEISGSSSNSPKETSNEESVIKPAQQILPGEQKSESTYSAAASKSKGNQVYHEDPLHSCRHLAAMGVVLYCIENIPNCTVLTDMYAALSYITGGQYLNVSGSQLSKVIKAAIAEEVSLENLVGYVRDYLCVAWLAWGRMKTRKPSCIDDLCENVFNYLQQINITALELLYDGKALNTPSKHAKKITTLINIGEARRLKDTEDNWAAEISWVMPEVCNEVISGYYTTSTENTKKESDKMVTLSGCKSVSKNQAMRVVIRTLARRPGLIRDKQTLVEQKTLNETEQQHTVHNQRTNVNEVSRVSKDNDNTDEHPCQEQCKDSTKRIEDEVGVERKTDDLSCHEQPITSCKQEELITEKLKETCTHITYKYCVLV